MSHHLDRSRRGLARLAAAVSIVLLMVACGSDEPTASAPDGAQDSHATDAAGEDHGDGGGAHEAGGEHGGDGHEAKILPIPEGARRIIVVARELAFEPETIEIAAGEPIALAVMNDSDLFHDFTLDVAGIHVNVNPGEGVTTGLQIDEPGEYEAICTVEGHAEAGMVMKVVVTEA